MPQIVAMYAAWWNEMLSVKFTVIHYYYGDSPMANPQLILCITIAYSLVAEKNSCRAPDQFWSLTGSIRWASLLYVKQTLAEPQSRV
jgi:hypothetical protein